MVASKALQMFVLTALCAGRAWSADIAQSCQTGPIAIQIDQLFQKTDSYTVARTEWMPQGRPEYGRIRGSHGGLSTSRATRRLHGEARTIARLSLAGRAVKGAASMFMQADEHLKYASQSCSLKRTFNVAWTFEGTLSDQCTLELTVIREWSGGAYDRPCTAGVPGLFGDVYPAIAESWQISLKAEPGASTKREVGNFAAKDISALTVIREVQTP